MWNHWCSILSLNNEEKMWLWMVSWFRSGNCISRTSARILIHNGAISKWVVSHWGMRGTSRVMCWGLYPTGDTWRCNHNLSRFPKSFVDRLMPQTESSKCVLSKEQGGMWPSAIATGKTIDLESTHVKCNPELTSTARLFLSLALELKIIWANVLIHWDRKIHLTSKLLFLFQFLLLGYILYLFTVRRWGTYGFEFPAKFIIPKNAQIAQLPWLPEFFVLQ